MNKWLGTGDNDDDADNGEGTAAAKPAGTADQQDGVTKWFRSAPGDAEVNADSDRTNDDTADPADIPDITGATVSESSDAEPTPADPQPASAYLTGPDALTTDDPATGGDTTTAGVTANTGKASARRGRKKPAMAKARPSRKRNQRERPVVPRWAVVTGAAVVVVGLVSAAAKFGADTFGGTDDPVLAGNTASEQVEEPSESPYETKESPAPEAKRTESNTPNDSTPVVSGQCEPTGDEERIGPSGKTLRGAVASFYDEYRAHNARGIGATLDEKSSMKKQNWEAVFDQLNPDASWCVRMGTDHGNKVDIQVRMNVDGEDTIFEQTATGISRDGQFKIQELKER